jgi:hypothetical protein
MNTSANLGCIPGVSSMRGPEIRGFTHDGPVFSLWGAHRAINVTASTRDGYTGEGLLAASKNSSLPVERE